MAWIESHTVLRNHRKVLPLSRALRINTAQTIGHLHLLWHAALEQQENGDLKKWNDELIAELAGYTGDAPQFVRLLQEFSWLGYRTEDDTVITGTEKMIHDWWDYAGRYLQGKYGKSPEKWQTIKDLHTNHQQTTSKPHVLPTRPTIPDLPIRPNLPKKDIAAKSPPPAPLVPKPKKETDPELKGVIDHICQSYERKKKAKYPFNGKHAKLLQGLVRIYEHAGVMALWDLFITGSDDFYRQTGYSIEGFGGCIPKLLDGPWKSVKQKYEHNKSTFMTPADVLKKIGNGGETP